MSSKGVFLFDSSLNNANKNTLVHCGGTGETQRWPKCTTQSSEAETPLARTTGLQQGENHPLPDFTKFPSLRKFFTFSNKNSSVLNLNHSKPGNQQPDPNLLHVYITNIFTLTAPSQLVFKSIIKVGILKFLCRRKKNVKIHLLSLMV